MEEYQPCFLLIVSFVKKATCLSAAIFSLVLIGSLQNRNYMI